MLDTDTCIYIINQNPKMMPKAEPARCAISVVVLGELERGKLLSRRKDYEARFTRFINGLTVAALNDEASRAYAKIRVHLEAKGKPIGPNDLWIAAHALAANLRLVTGNKREFSRVPGLSVESWMKR